MAASDHINKHQIAWKAPAHPDDETGGSAGDYWASVAREDDAGSRYSAVAGKHDDYVGGGSYRTEGRAKMAAQGMINRHREGRDMKTGKKAE